jgi:hypothetical protein
MVVTHVTELIAKGACPGADRYPLSPLAAVIPRPSYEPGYLHREFDAEPIWWADPASLAPQIERWLQVAAGRPGPLDALVHLLDRMPAEQQAQFGLPWVELLVMADPHQIANRSYALPEWLERVRPYSEPRPLLESWHRIVDALTVAGDNRVAALAD